MKKTSTLIVDKKTENGKFRFEERIKLPRFRLGVDYTVEGSMYFILSNKLKKDILLIKNPYSDNLDDYVYNLEMKILVDHEDDINIKPRIVTDLEQRERLIEIGKGINDFSNHGIDFSDEVRAIENADNGKNKKSRTVEKNTNVAGNLEITDDLITSLIASADASKLIDLREKIDKELKKRDQTEQSANHLERQLQMVDSAIYNNNNNNNNFSVAPVIVAVGVISSIAGLIV